MNIDTDYDQLKAVPRKWFGMLDNNNGENLPWDKSVAPITTPWHVLFHICTIAGNRLQSITKVNAELGNAPVTQENLYQEAGIPKPVSIPKYANGKRKPLYAHPETFRKGLWIVESGSKDPRIHIFKDGYELTEDGKPTYGSGRRWVSWVYTTWDNEVNGEQLFAWQQERLNKHR